MRDLQVDLGVVRSWFIQDDNSDNPVVMLVRLSGDGEASWLTDLVEAARRCYASDQFLEHRATEGDMSKRDVLAALLPDPGSVMAGDFGEILAFLFLGSAPHPLEVIGPKKWRLKQDRTKPAPHSDVVQFVVPDWPAPCGRDRLVCAEVKTKSTPGDSTPISAAIADSAKDRLGRLSKTLAWLKERAILGELEPTTMAVVDRFLEAIAHPPAAKEFWAVAVICTSLLEAELIDVPEVAPDDCVLAVIAVPGLRVRYEEVFAAIRASVNESSEGGGHDRRARSLDG
jgi:hypothetical protein